MNPEPNRIYPGDCLAVMATWPPDFVDTIITDAPYEFGFMSARWDSSGIAFNPAVWKECLRVAKPGAMLLCFGGPRTFHRVAVALEDAGWLVRDVICWLFGSGFPKSLDISKAIDKAKGAEREVIGQKTYAGPAGNGASFGVGNLVESDHKRDLSAPASDLARQWSGYGTALKPAWEPIILAMKPIDGTFAHNAEKWGVAGLNVDGGRIASLDGVPKFTHRAEPSANTYGDGKNGSNRTGEMDTTKGRWPANLILDEEAAGMLDGQSGDHPGCSSPSFATPKSKYRPDQENYQRQGPIYPGNGGASRFFYVAKADRAERNEGCEGMPLGDPPASARSNPAEGRSAALGSPRANHHPTVKPLSLMKYLCNLTRTPTGGIVLDPFCGSGTTLWAAEFHNRPWIGIEMNPEYVAIAEARIARERSQIKFELAV